MDNDDVPVPPTEVPPPSTTSVVNPPNAPLIKFPPFPEVPPGVKILPFKEFHEHGIQIFSEDGEEIDGLGIPTVALRVPHDTDECKTQAKKKRKKKKVRDGEEGDNEEEEEEEAGLGKWGKKKGKNGDIEPENKKLTPLERAAEQRRKRLLLFANNPFYIQWAEGEDLRGGKIYDTYGFRFSFSCSAYSLRSQTETFPLPTESIWQPQSSAQGGSGHPHIRA